ncbi:hypothetical protein BDB01DRAFT_799322 [Pilobolus umbonatus]|nr:hypothetical protein BDB01DRAFT_799322 [Pilobolus umbonatus]
MNEEYENVVWDVHATTDEFTPTVEINDPLSVYNEEPSTLPDNPVDQGSIHSPHTTPPIEVADMVVTLSDPQKQQDGQGPFISYLVTTKTNINTFNRQQRPVRRRFQDFVWLHTSLTLEYPACIIPPLPDKHRLEYIKGDRFSSEFIQRRQISLQWFLDRLCKHPFLQKSQCTRIFLESTDFVNDKKAQSRQIPPTISIFDSIGDTLINAFVKIKKPEEKFEAMKETIHKLEDNLTTIERLYARISKRQQDLQNDYASFAMSIDSLASLEPSISKSLHQFADTAASYSKAMKEMSTKESLLFLNEIHELLAYFHAARDVMKARDQKQMDFESLTVYLQETVRERDRIQSPNRRYRDRGTLLIGDYVTDKLNEVRGVNMEKIRRDKLNKLDTRVNELQHEVTRTNDESHEFSLQVIKEFDIFLRTKTQELKAGLMAYAECHIEFYQKGIALWEDILPVLERIDGIESDEV